MLGFISLCLIFSLLTRRSYSQGCPPGQILSHNLGRLSGSPIDLFFRADCSRQTITIEIEGPSNTWFGINFGTQMVSTNAWLFLQGELRQYRIGPNAQSQTNPFDISETPGQFESKNATLVNNRRRLIYTRRWAPGVGQGQLFTNTTLKFPIMWAKGPAGNMNLAYHGGTSADRANQGASIQVDLYAATPVTTSTTTSTTTPTQVTSPPGARQCPKGRLLQATASFPNLVVKFEVDCSQEIIRVELQGPDNRWFGILFGTQMVNSDALVYGKDSPTTTKLQDYFLASKLSGDVTPDSNQPWIEIENKVVNGKRIANYSRNWTDSNVQNKQFNASTLIFPIMWAIGKSGQVDPLVVLAHGTTQQDHAFAPTTVDMYSGRISTAEAGLKTANLIHALLMWLAFGICAPCGIWVSLFRSVFEDEDTWWLLHRIFMPFAILASLGGLVQAILMVIESQSGHFNSLHDLIGLFIIIIVVLQPVNAALRPKHEKYAEKDCERIIWEAFHKFLGYSAVLGAQYEMYLGVVMIGFAPTPLILFCVHEFLLVLFYGFGIYLRCRPEQDKSSMAGTQNTDIQITPYTNQGTNEPVQYV